MFTQISSKLSTMIKSTYYIFFFEETLSKKQGPLRDMPALQTTQEKPAKGGMPKSSMKNVKTTRDEHTF